jgi:hypothetical protein
MRTLAVAARGNGRGAGPLSPAELAGQCGTDFVMSDTEGWFVFHDLPKGPVQLSVSAPGYVDNGGAVPRRPPQLEDGEHLNDVILRLARTASISGIITDEASEPVVGVSVRAMSVPMGTSTYRLTGDARTDDRGMYRLDNLFPGTFYVLVPQTQISMPLADLEKNSEGIGGMFSANNPFIEALTGGAQSTIGIAGVRVDDQMWQMGGGMGVLGAAQPPPVNGRIAAYQTTFVPGVPEITQANRITVTSGEDRAGVDLQLRPVAASHVSGVLASPDGPATNVVIRLVAAPGGSDDDALPVATTTTSGTGAFTFIGVPAGAYIAKAQQSKGPSPFPASMLAGMPPEAAEAMAAMQSRMGQNNGDMNFLRAPIVVGDRDVDGVALTLQPGAKISGHVVFEGSTPPPNAQQLPNVQVSLALSVPGAVQGPFAGPATAKLTADAEFKTGSIAPGTYALTVQGVPAAWMVKSITAGGRDATTSGLEVANQDVADVTVTFTDRLSSLTGTVRSEGSGPLPSVYVIVLPADYRASIASGAIGRRQLLLTPSTAGVYNAARLPPGDYLVAAVPDDAMRGDRDQAFYDAIARVATPVTVAEGETKTLDLKVTGKIRG